MSHECPGPECESQVPPDMLACRRHWYQVPKAFRDALWKAWDDGEGAGSEEHHAAIMAAIDRMTP